MIGIDLGTTNSLVAVMGADGPRILPNELGEELTPSVVAVASDGVLLTGRAAKDRLIAAPDSGKAFFKRDMGTSTAYRFGGQRWTPVECSAVILREMKRIAELHLGKAVDSAVISVPAYFHDQQRQATVEAARIAGLRVERLVNEPTAAALAYGFRATDDVTTLLIFDLGGGTFDVTVLELFDGVVQVKSSAGESRLGGEDYTDALAEWIVREFKWEPAAEDRQRWRTEVSRLKHDLSAAPLAKVRIGEHQAPISRDDFAMATATLTARLRPVVMRALRDAGLTPKQLDQVLLVGGASRMKMVAELILADTQMQPNVTLDPDRVVALGAAVQQAMLADHSAVSEMVLTDVCPHSLGVEVAKALLPGHSEPGYFDPILDRNTTVPVSRSSTYCTLHPSQDEILLKIYQGEGRMTSENTLIGQIRIPGLRSDLGNPDAGRCEVRFSYDMNGILEVDVTTGDGRKLTKVFEQRPGTFSPAQMAEALARLAPLKVHPREQPMHRARLERASRLFAELRGEMRDSLVALSDAFEAALLSQEDEAISRLGTDMDTFMAPFFRHE
jgi:molecular chaperone HscC